MSGKKKKEKADCQSAQYKESNGGKNATERNKIINNTALNAATINKVINNAVSQTAQLTKEL